MTNNTIIAGVLVRREIRRALQAHNINFVEEKGFLDSQFTLLDTPVRNMAVLRAIARLSS